MELTFETVIVTNDGAKAHFSHEPDNRFIRYYKEGNRVGNKSADPIQGIFDNLTFESEARRLTPRAVKDFGIKSFPRLGSYGFFTPLHTPGSLVVIPINRDQPLADVPQVVVTRPAGKVHLAMTGNYECFRIVVRKDAFATEFVTYTKEFEFTPMYTGDCLITVTGHSNEIAITSNPFEYDIMF